MFFFVFLESSQSDVVHSRVDSDASISFHPLEEGLHPGEGCVHPNLAAQTGAEAGDPDLSVLAVLVEILQGAA